MLAGMDDRPLQVVLAGRYGVGKSFIFEKLPEEAERYGSGMFTVDTGTGLSLLSGRDKWMVHVKCSGGKDTTVRLAGEPGKARGRQHEVFHLLHPLPGAAVGHRRNGARRRAQRVTRLLQQGTCSDLRL